MTNAQLLPFLKFLLVHAQSHHHLHHVKMFLLLQHQLLIAILVVITYWIGVLANLAKLRQAERHRIKDLHKPQLFMLSKLSKVYQHYQQHQIAKIIVVNVLPLLMCVLVLMKKGDMLNFQVILMLMSMSVWMKKEFANLVRIILLKELHHA